MASTIILVLLVHKKMFREELEKPLRIGHTGFLFKIWICGSSHFFVTLQPPNGVWCLQVIRLVLVLEMAVWVKRVMPADQTADFLFLVQSDKTHVSSAMTGDIC